MNRFANRFARFGTLTLTVGLLVTAGCHTTKVYKEDERGYHDHGPDHGPDHDHDHDHDDHHWDH